MKHLNESKTANGIEIRKNETSKPSNMGKQKRHSKEHSHGIENRK